MKQGGQGGFSQPLNTLGGTNGVGYFVKGVEPPNPPQIQPYVVRYIM